MDGENNGKPYFLMDDLGGKPTIFGNTPNGPLKHFGAEPSNQHKKEAGGGFPSIQMSANERWKCILTSRGTRVLGNEKTVWNHQLGSYS